RQKPEESNAERRHSDESVRLASPQRIVVEPGCALEQKLAVAAAARQRLSIPLLKGTGSVVGRLEAGEGTPETRWDFQGAELATACADWIKARADVAFQEKQLATIRELNKDQVESQTKLVERLRKLVSLGTDPAKDLAAAEAELRKQKLQGQKDEH